MQTGGRSGIKFSVPIIAPMKGVKAMATLPLEQMTIKEKLQAMEELWSGLGQVHT